MTVINTNGAALRAMGATRTADISLNTAMERLSTGKRINSAKDDAAGLSIASGMTAQIMGMRQGMRNAVDGASLVQTAEGALDEVANMAQRIRELTIQSLSGTYSDQDRTSMQVEVSDLAKQITSSMDNASFNGRPLFDTNLYYDSNITPPPDRSLKIDIQAGANTDDRLTISIQNTPLAYSRTTWNAMLPASRYPSDATHMITFDDFVSGATRAGIPVTSEQIGNVVTELPGDQWYNVDNRTASTSYFKAKELSFVEEFSVANEYRASNTLERIDSFLGIVVNVRSELGAVANRLESAVNNLTSASTNLADAKSRIEDADFSVETTALARAQILKQASTAILAQANQSQQGVLKLLG